MTQEPTPPYQRHQPSAAIRTFLDHLDPGNYVDCGRARLPGIDDVLEREAIRRGRAIGEDPFMLVATDIGLIYCRPSISFAIAGRWADIAMEEPSRDDNLDDQVALPVIWPIHGRLEFVVSPGLAESLYEYWLALQPASEVPSAASLAEQDARFGQAQRAKPQKSEVVLSLVETEPVVDGPPEEAESKPDPVSEPAYSATLYLDSEVGPYPVGPRIIDLTQVETGAEAREWVSGQGWRSASPEWNGPGPAVMAEPVEAPTATGPDANPPPPTPTGPGVNPPPTPTGPGVNPPPITATGPGVNPPPPTTATGPGVNPPPGPPQHRRVVPVPEITSARLANEAGTLPPLAPESESSDSQPPPPGEKPGRTYGRRDWSDDGLRPERNPEQGDPQESQLSDQPSWSESFWARNDLDDSLEAPVEGLAMAFGDTPVSAPEPAPAIEIDIVETVTETEFGPPPVGVNETHLSPSYGEVFRTAAVFGEPIPPGPAGDGGPGPAPADGTEPFPPATTGADEDPGPPRAWAEHRGIVIAVALLAVTALVVALGMWSARSPAQTGSSSTPTNPTLASKASNSTTTPVASSTSSAVTSETTQTTASALLCHSNYSGCVPLDSDVDCEGFGDGPSWLKDPVVVLGADVYRIDTDGDGTACESDQPPDDLTG